ncbi:MAG: type II toxin-antitoxin system VapC family toxin [Gammaproteobacteria bacterium]|nr:type II toxin-antitoxin system VapC family toxin [Gammaproteobacteria bacterium]
MILLDTHVLLWLRFGSERLGKQTRQLIETAWQSGNIFVSAISFWEIALLQQKQRIEFDQNVDVWRRTVIEQGTKEVSVDGKIAIRAVNLSGLHSDAADRIIVSTALEGYQLATVDRRILGWHGDLERIDATR